MLPPLPRPNGCYTQPKYKKYNNKEVKGKKINKNKNTSKNKTKKKINKNIYNIPKKVSYSNEDIWNAAVVTRVQNQYENAFNNFRVWLQLQFEYDKSHPTLTNIIDNKNPSQLSRIIINW